MVLPDPPMDLSDRIQLTLSYLISTILAFAAVGAFYEGQWFNGSLAVFCFILSYLPAIIERNFRISLPTEFEFLFLVFLFVTIYLGEISAYYTTYWWWDIFLHTLSGVLLGFVGFLLIYILNTESRIRLHLSPVFVALFSFAFSMMIGVFWEFFEFFADTFFGFDMQHGSLDDTMTDLMVDALGALFISALGYFYVKKVQIPIFDRLIEKFLQKNPRLFKRWRKS